MLRGSLVVALAAMPSLARADEPVHRIEELSLEDLLNKTVEVTAQQPQNLRESVGVITVVTHDEMVRSGARDLMDVLQRVPGFQVAEDLLNVADVGFRGMWGHEGKVLLLIDGMPINDLLYGNNYLGNEYPVDQMERVEIIRGPGSVIYGGTAELAVINVITRDAGAIGIASASVMYGQTTKNFERRDISVQLAHVIDAKQNFAVTLGAFFGQGNRTEKDYTDAFGTTVNLDDQERMNPHYVNFGLTFDKLKVRALYDVYHTDSEAGYDAVQPYAYSKDFKWMIGSATYDYAVMPELTLTPTFQYFNESPWNAASVSSPYHSDITVQRFFGGLTGSWNVRSDLNILAGVSAYHDHAHDNDPNEGAFGTTTQDAFYNDYSVFAQGLYSGTIGHIALGARYENHDQSGGAFVPRAAYTKTFGAFHVKALAAQSFRAPVSGDLAATQVLPGVTILPEKTTSLELEVGYKISDLMFAALNVFDTKIKNPIVYDDNLLYHNFPQTGSRGVEATWRLQHPHGWAEATYSFYTTTNDVGSDGLPHGINQVPNYVIPGHNNSMLGFANHKLTLVGNIDVAAHFSIAPSIVFLSKRFAETSYDSTAMVGTYTQVGPDARINLYAMYHDLGTRYLDLGVGLYNLTNDRNELIQPYNSFKAPLPTSGRSVLARLSYAFK